MKKIKLYSLMMIMIFSTACTFTTQNKIVCEELKPYEFYPIEYNLTKVEDINLTGKVHFTDATHKIVELPFALWKPIILNNQKRKSNIRKLKKIIKWRELDIAKYEKFNKIKKVEK